MGCPRSRASSGKSGRRETRSWHCSRGGYGCWTSVSTVLSRMPRCLRRWARRWGGAEASWWRNGAWWTAAAATVCWKTVALPRSGRSFNVEGSMRRPRSNLGRERAAATICWIRDWQRERGLHPYLAAAPLGDLGVCIGLQQRLNRWRGGSLAAWWTSLLQVAGYGGPSSQRRHDPRWSVQNCPSPLLISP